MPISQEQLKEWKEEFDSKVAENNIHQFQLFSLKNRPVSTKKLNWRVFTINQNSDQVEANNLFDLNWEVNGRIYEATKTIHNFNKWEKEVLAILHEFWSRCQYEIEITDIFGSNKVSQKIDVFTQITMNWDHFINYLWDNKVLILEELEDSFKSWDEYRSRRQKEWKEFLKLKEGKK